MERDRSNFSYRYLPLLLALLATFLPLAWIILQVRHFTGGPFVYPVDDAYIHLQLAKMLDQHGTWGVNPGSFGSASSSLLYTAILAVAGKINSSVYLPLVINGVAALLLLICTDRWLMRQGLGWAARTVALLSIVFFTPLPVLVLSGMEHTLQCLFAFLFLSRFASWLGGERKALPQELLLWALFTATVRYEGLFLVAAACLVLAFRSRWSWAFLLGSVAILPALIFGIYSWTRGSYFLPNSVLIKSGAAGLANGWIKGLGGIIIEKFTMAAGGITLLATQRLLFILPLLLLVLLPFVNGEKRKYGYFIAPLLLATAPHLALADTGKFYRYEAYLVMNATAITAVLLALAGRDIWKGDACKRLLVLALGLMLVLPLVLRSAAAFAKSKQACLNIYGQQYQMAQFLQRYHPKEGVAANDIGAITYFNELNLLDLWGLASIDVARAKQKGYWNAPFLDSLARSRGVRIAVMYDSWMPPALPSRWTRLAVWTIPDNVVCGDDKVSFYALRPEDAPQLKKELIEYQPHLPPGVGATVFP